MEGLALPRGPPPGLHDGGALVEEELRYGNSLVQESAGIPPHVEDEAAPVTTQPAAQTQPAGT